MLPPSENADYSLSVIFFRTFSTGTSSLFPLTTCFLMRCLISPRYKSYMNLNVVFFLKNSQTRIIPQVFTFMDIAQVIVKFCVMISIYSSLDFVKRFRY